MWKVAIHENVLYGMMHLNQVSSCMKMHMILKQINHSLYHLKKVWALKFCTSVWLHSNLQVSTSICIQCSQLHHRNCRFHLNSSSFSWRNTHRTWKMVEMILFSVGALRRTHQLKNNVYFVYIKLCCCIWRYEPQNIDS
jgi:hypothetical protein